jgi:asparagine synthase (glutamine-hydrolysing)
VIEFDFSGRERARSSCRPEVASGSPLHLEQTLERVGELIRQSVARRLHNNPSPVSLLSGGIDSTVVTNHLWQSGKGRAITLRSLVPLGLDERYARYAAWRLGIPLELVSARTQRLEQEVIWALDLQDEPLGMISFFPLALLIQRAKTHGKILLTGDGADEVFCGYGQPEDWQDSARGTDEYSLEERGVAAGLPPPAWMSPWGQYTAGHGLLGHMFPKLDRASAEQGVEARCPLVDWDLLAFVRSLGPKDLFFTGRPKALLKAQLAGWPGWFVERRKIGFAYRLRWIWGLQRFRGLREMVTPEAVETFGEQVSPSLRHRPQEWRSRHIFRNFPEVWKLLAWSRFRERLGQAQRHLPDEGNGAVNAIRLQRKPVAV